MTKFSLIVPVYNTEKYLEKCLNSIINQTFDDYEVIVVNDGSTDNSEKIIDDFCNKYTNIKKLNKENGGLSDARNKGISVAEGEYLLFIDSDDYIENNLLYNINDIIKEKDYDLIKFGYDLVYENKIENTNNFVFDKEYNGEEVFKKMVANKNPFEMAWLYAYKRSFWNNYYFSYPKGYYHEDLGLTPKIILKAKSFYSIYYIGYHYVQMGSSITRGNDYKKIIKRAYDVLYHFDNLYNEINNDEDISLETKKIFNSYISNALIMKIDNLKEKDRKEFIKKLKERHVFDLLISDNLKHKLKKCFLKLKYFRY